MWSKSPVPVLHVRRARLRQGLRLGACLLASWAHVAHGLQIESSGTYKTAFAKGVNVAAAAPGTGCGFVSGGPVGPFALNSFGIAAPGACPITITTASDRLSSLGGAVGIAIAGTGYTSYGGTVTKALNQFVFGERDRLVPATTTLLAKGIGGWDTIGNPAQGAPAGFVYYGVGASGGTAAGVTYSGLGLAQDPFTLGPGTYEYQPAIEALALMNDDVSGVAAELFVAESPLGLLWALNVSLDGVGNVGVNFTSYPLLATLGVSINDTSVQNGLRGALSTSVPHAVTLSTPYSLFPTSSFLTITSPTEFSETAFAYAGAVPEPSTIVLLGMGLAVLIGIEGRRRKARASCP